MSIYALIRDESVENVILLADTADYETDLLLVEAPDSVGPGWRYVNGEFVPPPTPETPPAPYDPRRVSKIEFRRLLLPQEAAAIRLAQAAPRITAEELAAAFDPETPNPELQIRVALEDAFQQFDLLPEYVELNHPDTADFLTLLSIAGIIAPERVPVILSGTNV